MSVQSATTRNDYTAGASQTVYAYTFEIKAASDITVIVGGVTKSLNTDYTVSGVGTNSGGNVTLSAAPASGTTVSLVMEMDLARDTDYQANGAFLADDVNNDFDSLWLATNQQETELGRSLRLNQTEPTSDMTLPLKDARKGSVLAFNETTGLPVAGPTIANVDSVAGITGDIATVADNDANITTVAGISGDVTSVANISANVTTVAGNTTNINAVAADASDIGTVASNISNVNTTAGISSDVTTVAGNNVNITTVAGDSSEITTVAGVASDVSTVSGIASDVTAVAGDASDIGTVASSISNVNAVGTNITNVNNVAGNASNINTVAADGTDIGTVAGISANVTTVAGISSDVTTVAGLETKMDTVIADASDIGTVAGISASVTTVANNSSNVTTVAGLETKMDTIIADAADIGAVATNINSVTTVSGISGDVTTVASKASDVETVADNIGDVQAASQNATNAAASAQAAASSASTAGTHATNASASASQAANSATGADDSEAAAGISASAASSSASAASSSASSAASSASDANDSQAAAALSASGASVSASAAAVSAGNSETAAATWNNFYTTYLGAAASAPSTDLLGQPLQDGALYFNTTDDTMYVFNGSIWIAAESTINIVSVPTQLAADLTTNGNDIIFGDNDKATFGASDDLQIYHDGSNSYISDQGTGSLILEGTTSTQLKGSDFVILRSTAGENMAVGNANGSFDLYHNNFIKLTTTSTGIDVTGNVVADGLSVTNTATTGTNQEVASFRTASGGGLVIRSSDLSAANPDSILEPFFGESLKVKTSGNDRFKVAGNGDISFYEDTGTTPKFFWDASAEELEIGTSTDKLELGDSYYRFRKGNQNKILVGNTASALGSGTGLINYLYDAEPFIWWQGTERMRIDSTGRVGIGTSSPAATLHVDASSPEFRLAQSGTAKVRFRTSGDNYINTGHNLGIGTSSPSSILSTSGTDATTYSSSSVGGQDSSATLKIQNLTTSANTFASIDFNTNNNRVVNRIVSSHGSTTTDGFLAFVTEGSGTPAERMRIDSTGKVGIGTDSPASKLHLADTSTVVTFEDTNSTNNSINTITNYEGTMVLSVDPNNNSTVAESMRFSMLGTERMRIESSGNVLVGKTATGLSTDGTELAQGGTAGKVQITRTSNAALLLNRRSTDGTIADFRKDGTTVGSIGNSGVNLMIGKSDTGLGFSSSADAVFPINTSTGSNRSSAIDLGASTARFKDLYLSGTAYAGVLNLKDGNTNGQINCLTPTGGKLYTNTYAEQISQIQGSEKMRLDSSGNLLVGKTANNNSAVGVSIRPNEVSAVRDGGNPLLLNRLTSDGDIAIFRKDGTNVGSIGTKNGYLQAGTADTQLAYVNSDKSIRPFLANGSNSDGNISLGVSGARFKDLYLSGGVYLGGTGAANKLDDYEEGTFNITVNGDTTGVISAQTGNYVKIGKVVHIDCAFVVSTNFTSSSVGGLPFTPSIATNASSLRPLSILVNNAQDVSARTANGSTTISFGEVSNGTAHEPDTSSGVYRISGSYTTA